MWQEILSSTHARDTVINADVFQQDSVSTVHRARHPDN